MTLLKKTRIFWIYDLIITIFLSAVYFVKGNPSGLFAWPMIMGYHQIGIFEVFIAGPFFATKIQKNNLTTKELVWSTFLIFTMTFITFCIPEFTLTQQFTLHYWKVFLEQKIFAPLLLALIVSITYCITNIICKKVRR